MIANSFLPQACCVLVVSAPLDYTKAENIQQVMELDLDITETSFLIETFERAPETNIHIVGKANVVAALKQHEPKGTIVMLRDLPKETLDNMERVVFDYADPSGYVVLSRVIEQPAPNLNYAFPV